MADTGASLRGDVALVTGAGRRLGRAIALDLAAHGANVVVHHRTSRDDALAVVKEVRDLGVEAWPLGMDVLDGEALVDAAADVAGVPLTVLVNSASIYPAGDLATVTPEELRDVMDVNAWAPLALARRFAAQVPRDGAVVNLLDTTVGVPALHHAAYQVSKAALAHLTRMTALAFAPRVRVNAVAPGAVLPPEGQGAEYLEALATGLPLRRHGGPSDVAAAVRYLATAPFVTGQTIFVDGGRHLQGMVH